MKKILLILLFMISAAFLYSQDFTNQRVIRYLELSEDEVSQLNEMQLERSQIIEEAQIEQNLIRAQLEKLLFPPDADLRAIEGKMEESLSWRLKVEMANITIRVKARRLFGEERWRKFLQLQKEMRSRQEENNVGSESRRDN